MAPQSELYVVRNRKTGLYNQTGLFGTPHLQSAVIYSGRARSGTRRLSYFKRSPKYDVIPVRIETL